MSCCHVVMLSCYVAVAAGGGDGDGVARRSQSLRLGRSGSVTPKETRVTIDLPTDEYKLLLENQAPTSVSSC